MFPSGSVRARSTHSTANLYNSADFTNIRDEIIVPSRIKSKSEWKTFIWNSEKREFLGRNKRSWGNICAFYVGFYFFLALYFTCLLAIFMEIFTDKNNPTMLHEESILAMNPGLSFRPNMDMHSALIWYDQSDKNSWTVPVQMLTEFLEQYENENQVGDHYIECPDGVRPMDDPEKVCRFDLNTLGNNCSWATNYGYLYGSPCVLLKLSKIVNWEAEAFTEETRPQELGQRWRKQYIGVTCEGVTAADKENIGQVNYFPPEGFPAVFYPFVGQMGWRHPLVMVEFLTITKAVMIAVECKAWAGNIRHSRYLYEQAGSVVFHIMVD